MVFDKLFKSNHDDEQTEEPTKRIKGKIYHLSKDGYAFISSPEIEFTRIFMHWTGLEGDTKNFKELEIGDEVEFMPIEVKDDSSGKMQIRAIKVRVL